MHRATTPEEWSESCALTGLEIKQGSPAWIVVVDKDFANGSGPCAYFGWRTPPVRGVYAGQGCLIVPKEPDAVARYELAWDIADLNKRNDRLIGPNTINSDQELLFIGGSVFKHLGELPCHPTAAWPTIGERVATRRKELLELLKDCTASEVAGREANKSLAYDLWEEDPQHSPEYEQWTGKADVADYVESLERLELLLDADHDSQLLFYAFDECRKVAVPATETGPALGGHQAVSALAALVRRKAIHAGFEPT